MGLEADCRVRSGGKRAEGHARLEEKELVFRGDFRLKVPLAAVTRAEAKSGRLELEWTGGTASFELGDQAARWADRIRSPRSLMDKLGVKPGARVSVLGVPDPGFGAQVEARGADVSARLRKGSDLLFVFFSSAADLGRMESLMAALEPAGALWALWTKGRRELREDDIRRAALPLGLVDVKVASISDTLSGLKLMIRRDRR